VAKYRVHDHSATADIIRGGGWARAESRVVKGLFARRGADIADARSLGTEGRYSLALRALLRSGRSFWRGDRRGAIAEGICALGMAPRLLRSRHAWLLLAAVARGNQAAKYRHAVALSDALREPLAALDVAT